MEVYREEHSVVRRYANHLDGIDMADLHRSSLREGARIVQLPSYRGVDIDVLDMSTLSTTGTFKDWVACVTVAESLTKGHQTILAQSSGNTGNALARYMSNVGIRCVILYPPTSRKRIRHDLAGLPGVNFIEVVAAEKSIKDALREYADSSGIPAVPSLRNQYEGNKLRAYFLRDATVQSGCHWNWHAQAISSSYGPFGFYRGISEIQHSGSPLMPSPRFLGIQQEAVTPYVRAITGTLGDPAAPMIEPTLFRQALTPALIDELRHICATSHGTVRHLPNYRYRQLERQAIDMLHAGGVAVTLDDNGEPRERAGLYSLAGVFDTVDDDVIKPGDRVLAVYTGGSGTASTESFEPKHIANPNSVAAVILATLAA